MPNPYISDIANISTVLSALFTIIGAVVILFGIKELRFASWLKAQEIFTNVKFKESRRIILKRYKPNITFYEDSRNFINDADIVCGGMDELTRLIPNISKKRVLETWYDPIGKSWHILKEHVRLERETINSPLKWASFEDIGREAYQIVKMVENIKNGEKLICVDRIQRSIRRKINTRKNIIQNN